MNKELFKKIKNNKFILNKKNLKNGRINIKLNNIKKSTENLSKSPIPKIKSKSTNKLKTKIVNGMNKLPTIKLPIVKNQKKLLHINEYDNVENATMNNIKLKKYLENDNLSKLKIKTNKSFNNIKNFHSTQNSKKFLLGKERDTSYNMKRSHNFIKIKNNNIVTNPNMGLNRHLDRKKMTENKSIILSNNKLKLFKDNTIKISSNKSNKTKEKYKLNHNNHKKIKELFEFEQKDKKIKNIFNRNNIKTEISIENTTENINEEKNFDIISDISLSEEELNFSEEDSIDNMEFSLDNEDL
jgi:hypothetical protein